MSKFSASMVKLQDPRLWHVFRHRIYQNDATFTEGRPSLAKIKDPSSWPFVRAIQIPWFRRHIHAAANLDTLFILIQGDGVSTGVSLCLVLDVAASIYGTWYFKGLGGQLTPSTNSITDQGHVLVVLYQ